MKPLLVILLLIGTIFGGQGSAGAKFLQLNTTTLGVGSGGTYVARPGLLEAVNYNPASIATLQGFNASITQQNYFAEIKVNHTVISYRMPFGVISGGFSGLFSGSMEETTEEIPLGTGRMFSANDYAAQFSYARKLTNKFSGGITFKYITQHIDKLASNGYALDMGAIYETGLFNNLTIGFAMRNFGPYLHYEGENLERQIGLNNDIFEEEDVKIEIASEEYSLPTSFEMGASTRYSIGNIGHLYTSLAVRNIIDQAEFISAGIEFHYRNLLFVSIGHGNLNHLLNKEYSDEELKGNMRIFCGSFGINLRSVLNQETVLSYAFEMHKYLSPVHLIGFSFKL